jgi:hypothetical protein
MLIPGKVGGNFGKGIVITGNGIAKLQSPKLGNVHRLAMG